MTDHAKVKERLAEINPDALTCDRFDDALVSIGRRFNSPPVAVYSISKVLDILEADMSRDDAREYFEFNSIGAWVGDHTPIFLEDEDQC